MNVSWSHNPEGRRSEVRKVLFIVCRQLGVRSMGHDFKSATPWCLPTHSA